MDRTKEELQETIRQQAIKNGQLTEQLQAAEIECVRLNNRIEELENYALCVDAVPLTELLELRDNLYETDRITMNGIKMMNSLIAKYDGEMKTNERIHRVE